MTFPSRHANHCTILALYIYLIITLYGLPSLIFIISQLGPSLWCALVRFFFPSWAGQIGPSIAPGELALPMALIASISGHFQTKFSFWLILGFLRLLGGSGDGTSICLNINSIKANPLVRYGGPGEGVKKVK